MQSRKVLTEFKLGGSQNISLWKQSEDSERGGVGENVKWEGGRGTNGVKTEVRNRKETRWKLLVFGFVVNLWEAVWCITSESFQCKWNLTEHLLYGTEAVSDLWSLQCARGWEFDVRGQLEETDDYDEDNHDDDDLPSLGHSLGENFYCLFLSEKSSGCFLLVWQVVGKMMCIISLK